MNAQLTAKQTEILQQAFAQCPFPNPKFVTRHSSSTKLKATVCFLRKQARENGTDVEKSWADQYTPANLSGPYMNDWGAHAYNINPLDIPAAIAKWEKDVTEQGVYRIVYTFESGKYQPI